MRFLRFFARELVALVVAVFVALAVVGSSRTSVGADGSRVQHAAIRRTADAASGAGVEVDLYVPRLASAELPPLVVLLHAVRKPTRDDVTGASVGDALEREGIAVAVVRFTLADDYLFPQCLVDVAAVVRDLADHSVSYGFDARRPVLLGDGAGASMAAMLGLDPTFGRSSAGGVIAMRGTYDLSDAALEGHPDKDFFSWAFGGDAAERDRASPVNHVRADAPPFLVLSGSEDAPEWSQIARRFAERLERSGARDVERYVVPGRDDRNALALGGRDDELRTLIASFVRHGGPLPLEGPWGVKQIWTRAPLLSSDAFWADEHLVTERPIDDRFRGAVQRVLGGAMYELHPYAGKFYRAIDVGSWLDAHPREVGQGDYLIVTNIRGERTVLTRRDVSRYHPMIVVGLDDERNLYRLITSYQLSRGYSWKPNEGPMPVMARPVGAFLHFPEEPPPHLRTFTYAPYGLMPESFRLVTDDPLQAVRDVSDDVADALYGEQGCLTCHSFRGSGPRSHHVRAADGKEHGAYALPLEEYAPTILYDFLFDQETVASSFGVLPLRLPEGTAEGLYELVSETRDVR
jgi:acetyl esterase/lipase